MQILVFHIWKKFGEAIPDSALLIIVGLILGYVLHVFHIDAADYALDNKVFFLFLLPPIIFDAGIFRI